MLCIMCASCVGAWAELHLFPIHDTGSLQRQECRDTRMAGPTRYNHTRCQQLNLRFEDTR